ARVKKSSSMVVSMFGVAVIVMMAIVRMAMVGHRPVFVQHAPVREMSVVVMVAVDGQRSGGTRTEEMLVFGARYNGLRRAATAHVPIEADQRIRLCHDHMQVVRDQKYPATRLVTDAADQIVESDLAGEVHALQRLVEHHQIGLAHDR